MKKKMYIEPKMDTMVVQTSAMMEGNPLSGGSFPSNTPANPAPMRRVTTAANDSVPVF